MLTCIYSFARSVAHVSRDTSSVSRVVRAQKNMTVILSNASALTHSYRNLFAELHGTRTS